MKSRHQAIRDLLAASEDGHRFKFREYKYLERFEALVRADEREECAMTAENISMYDRYSPEDTIADAIRKRGQA